MVKRVFFAFHYKDVIDFRANVVRNHWLTKDDREEAGFFDASLWENTKKRGDPAIKRLINSGLDNTSVTVVLIGSQTCVRRWVRYEIMKSMKRGNKLLGVHINGIPDKNKQTKKLGPNPFDYLGYSYSNDGKTLQLWEWSNLKWVKYEDIDSYTLNTQSRQDLRGKSYNLSALYPTYDWIKDGGYKNFATWIG